MESCKRCKEYHEHIYWEHNDSRRLRFEKTMVGDFSRRVSIPEKFMSRVNLPEIIDLKGPSGNSWNVGLAKSEGNVFLQYGWKEFVEAHNLEENDVLIFKYKGKSRFSVLVFDSSECERESTYFSKNQHCKEQEETDECSVKILQPSRAVAQEVYGCTSTSRPNAGNIREESSPSQDVPRGQSNCFTRETQKGKNILFPKAETVEESLIGNHPRNRNSPRRPATDARRDHAMKLAGEFRTNKPSFVTKIKGYNVCNQFQLLIPPEFADEFLPQKSQEIVLQVPRAKKEWKVNYCVGETAARLIGKWRNFVRDNALKEGDACVFVLSKGGKKLVMTVHIFRALNKAETSSTST